MSKWKKILGSTITFLLLIGATATTAQAYNTASYWNTSSSPLVASGYGSKAQTYGYIKIFNGSSGTRMYNYSWNKFIDADNHQSYLSATSQFNAGSCANLSVQVVYKGVSVGGSSNCAKQFYDRTKFPRSTGLNYTKNTWVAMPTVSVGVHSGADRGRAKVQACIDIPLRVDKCSGVSYSSADSW